MSLCLSYSMTDTSKAKEWLEESNTSFWTTPSDDGFRFSNLTTSHMSMLKESGPFVAIVLSYWDNLLGPRLQHVWRGAGDTESQVGLSLGIIFVLITNAIESQANQNTGKPLYILRYYIRFSHHAPHVCYIDCVGHCSLYGMV